MWTMLVMMTVVKRKMMNKTSRMITISMLSISMLSMHTVFIVTIDMGNHTVSHDGCTDSMSSTLLVGYD